MPGDVFVGTLNFLLISHLYFRWHRLNAARGDSDIGWAFKVVRRMSGQRTLLPSSALKLTIRKITQKQKLYFSNITAMLPMHGGCLVGRVKKTWWETRQCQCRPDLLGPAKQRMVITLAMSKALNGYHRIPRTSYLASDTAQWNGHALSSLQVSGQP